MRFIGKPYENRVADVIRIYFVIFSAIFLFVFFSVPKYDFNSELFIMAVNLISFINCFYRLVSIYNANYEVVFICYHKNEPLILFKIFNCRFRLDNIKHTITLRLRNSYYLRFVWYSRLDQRIYMILIQIVIH